jgi:CcmD family protein
MRSLMRMKRFHKWLAATLLLSALALPAAHAQQPRPPTAAAGARAEWEDADLRAMMGPGERYQSTTMVTTAYLFIWLMVLGFVVSVWTRSRRVERELMELAQRIGQAGGARPPAPTAIEKR